MNQILKIQTTVHKIVHRTSDFVKFCAIAPCMTVVMIKEFLKKIVMLTDAGMFEHVHTLVLTDKSIHDLPQLNTTMSEHFGLFAEHLSFEFYPVNHH